jgi:hypothetical protein
MAMNWIGNYDTWDLVGPVEEMPPQIEAHSDFVKCFSAKAAGGKIQW